MQVDKDVSFRLLMRLATGKTPLLTEVSSDVQSHQQESEAQFSQQGTMQYRLRGGTYVPLPQ